jgi:hypothetical protein
VKVFILNFGAVVQLAWHWHKLVFDGCGLWSFAALLCVVSYYVSPESLFYPKLGRWEVNYCTAVGLEDSSPSLSIISGVVVLTIFECEDCLLSNHFSMRNYSVIQRITE